MAQKFEISAIFGEIGKTKNAAISAWDEIENSARSKVSKHIKVCFSQAGALGVLRRKMDTTKREFLVIFREIANFSRQYLPFQAR
ncbi:MAG: hypothetical protein GY737_17150 [Desulfobacteraceae bacterium]|nr:hypothetical protein [Desulfobacteraceae bacterium]